MKKIGHFFKGAIGIAAATIGGLFASDGLICQRLMICVACNRNTLGTCEECGCAIAHLVRLKKDRCKLHKWPKPKGSIVSLPVVTATDFKTLRVQECKGCDAHGPGWFCKDADRSVAADINDPQGACVRGRWKSEPVAVVESEGK